MIIDDIFNDVIKLKLELAEKRGFIGVNIAIFMREDFYSECMREFSFSSSQNFYGCEFQNNAAIAGYPVFIVSPPRFGGIKPPACTICEVKNQ